MSLCRNCNTCTQKWPTNLVTSFFSRSYAQQLYYSAEENIPHATDVLQMPQLNVPRGRLATIWRGCKKKKCISWVVSSMQLVVAGGWKLKLITHFYFAAPKISPLVASRLQQLPGACMEDTYFSTYTCQLLSEWKWKLWKCCECFGEIQLLLCFYYPFHASVTEL